jgi:hypothetical protein
MERQPPFTTRSGLQIGLLYQAHRPVHHDRDALRLQDALLNKRQPTAIEMALMHLVRRFWAWC